MAAGRPRCVAFGGPCGTTGQAEHGSTGQVGKALAHGAEANRYIGDVWTLPRVAEVIERLTGLAYHPGYVWYILRKQLRWSWERPARKAVERDDAAAR
jgi:transposase